MSWNYRIIDTGADLALHEVYYDDAGQPDGRTAGPATFTAGPEQGVAGIIASLERALEAARTLPVLPDPWPDSPDTSVEQQN